MAKLPRFQPDKPATGKDLNLLMAAFDTSGSNQNSVTSSGTTGSGLSSAGTTGGSSGPTPGTFNTPNTPTGLTARTGIDNYAQAHTAYVVLSWTPNPVVDFVSRYDVYWHKGTDQYLHNISVGGDVQSVRINDVFPGNTYSFAVQAHDAANRSSLFSSELIVVISLDIDPPNVPTGLTATGTGSGVYLNWTEVTGGTSSDLKQYQIAVSLDGGATYPNLYTAAVGNSFFYTPTTSAQGTVWFKIATVDWTGNTSLYSTPVSAAVGTILGPTTISPGPLTVRTVTGTWASEAYIIQGGIIGTGKAVIIGYDNVGDYGYIGAIDHGVAWKGLHLDPGQGGTTLGGNLTFTLANPTITASSYAIVPGGAYFNSLPIYTEGHINARGGVWNDSGASAPSIAFGGALNVPITAGGSTAPTNYGTVPVKIDEKSGTGSPVGTYNFTSIPQGFRSLELRASIRDTSASSGTTLVNIQFNGDTGANYYVQRLTANGGTTTAAEALGSTAIGFFGGAVGGGSSAHIRSAWRATIENYASASEAKSIHATGFVSVGTATANQNVEAWGGWWNSAAAITSISLNVSIGFDSVSYASLWGYP